MRRKNRDEGTYYILGAIALSVIFALGGFLIKGSKAEETYVSGAKEEAPEEKKEKNLEKLLFILTKEETLNGISFIEFNEEEKEISHKDYKGDLIIKNNNEAITLKELYNKNKKIDKKVIEENFKEKDYKIITVELNKTNPYVEKRDTIEGLFLAKSKLSEEKYKNFKTAFKSEEKIKLNDEFLKEIKKDNIKEMENNIKEIKVEKIIDEKVFIFLSQEDKKRIFYFLEESDLKEYPKYKELKEKEEHTLRNIKEKEERKNQNQENTNSQEPVKPSGENQNNGNQESTKPSGGNQNDNTNGENKPVVKPEKPDTKPDEKPDEKPDVKPEKPDTKPDVKPEKPGGEDNGNSGIGGTEGQGIESTQ